MHVPVEIQVWRVAVLALLGIGADLVFHAYRAYRSVFQPKNLRYHLLDALVALLTLGAIGTVVFLVNWGEIRLYVPLSLAGGFLTGNLLVGDITYRWARKGFLNLQRGMRWAKVKVIDPPRNAARRGLKKAAEALAKLSPLSEPPCEPPSEPPPAEGGETKSPE